MTNVRQHHIQAFLLCFTMPKDSNLMDSKGFTLVPLHSNLINLMFFSILSQQVAKMIGADAKEIVFTSGATESNNIAVKGVARFYSTNKKHVITTQTEHKCVLDSCRQLEAEGFDVTYLPVQQNGIINLEVIVFHLFVRGV